jgi:hypothetical protein
MKLSKLNLSVFGAALIALVVISCKDDFTEGELLELQKNAKIDELKSITAADSLQFLLAMEELDYRRYLDSLSRADSLAIAAGNAVYLPYSYEVQVLNGSVASISNGKTEKAQAFASDITVTITQYGVKQTRTGRDGLFTFSDIGVGAIHGTVSGTGFTTFSWTVDASLPFQMFKEAVQVALSPGGAGGAGGGTGGSGTSSTYFENNYILEQLLKYFNQRSFGNDFTIFETTGANASVLGGRMFIETNTTNRTREVVTGAAVTAYLDVNNGPSAFAATYVTAATAPTPINDPAAAALNSVFQPDNWAYEFIATATTDATGDFSLTLPGSPKGLPIAIEYSDVVANKTYFLQTNGDVTQVTRRNIYGPGRAYTAIPNISMAPTVQFDAGGGASAFAVISGNGSVTDLDLTSGGQNFQGTPRVIIGPPPAGGTQATATATVTNGVVTALTLVSGGSGYTGAPSVIITEGTGGAATEGGSSFGATHGGVASVQLTNVGNGFNGILPNVVFYVDLNSNLVFNPGEQLDIVTFPTGVNTGGFSSGTNFPAAVAVNNTNLATLSHINVTNNGGGMNFEPRVLITSGLGAAVNVTTTGGVVTAATVATGGLFYSAPPTITLPSGTFGPGTTQAVLTGVLTGGVLTGVSITNPGAGYLNTTGAATVASVGGGAVGQVVWRGLGIGSITVTSAGSASADNLFYTNVPRVIISAPNFAGPGSTQAAATAVLGADGRLIGVNITNVGSGYYPASLVTVTIQSGTGASANASLGNRFVDEIEVTSQGSGYIVAPTVIIVDPDKGGSGATAVAKLDNGFLTSIEVTNPGNGYGPFTEVFILDPGTSFDALAGGVYNNPALANVFVTNGVVSSVEVYQNGGSYPAGTRVLITSSKGNGFTATATVSAAGEISDVTIVTGGTGYVGNNYLRGIGGLFNPNADVTVGSGIIAFVGVPLSSGAYIAKSGVRRTHDVDMGSGQNAD